MQKTTCIVCYEAFEARDLHFLSFDVVFDVFLEASQSAGELTHNDLIDDKQSRAGDDENHSWRTMHHFAYLPSCELLFDFVSTQYDSCGAK